LRGIKVDNFPSTKKCFFEIIRWRGFTDENISELLYSTYDDGEGVVTYDNQKDKLLTLDNKKVWLEEDIFLRVNVVDGYDQNFK
jgi:hypothetical protein